MLTSDRSLGGLVGGGLNFRLEDEVAAPLDPAFLALVPFLSGATSPFLTHSDRLLFFLVGSSGLSSSSSGGEYEG